MKKTLFSILFIISLFFIRTAYADKIAIIGGGASGLVTAWLLEQDHDVTLYEAQDKLGGHADSVTVNVDGESVVVEAATEFFNDPFYPHFMKLLRYFHIPLNKFTLTNTFYKTDGSDVFMLPPFHDGQIEWKSLTPSNLSRSLQLKTVVDNARTLIKSGDTAISVRDFVNTLNVSKEFKETYLYPLLASAWGVSLDDIQEFSALNSLKYLVDGGDIPNYKWYEVVGGLKIYIDAVKNSLQKTEIKLNARVTQLGQNNGHYTVLASDGSLREYDHIVFAIPMDVASALLSNLPNENELATTLGKVKYYDTKIAIHSDRRFMPPDQADWRVANIRYDGTHSELSVYKSWRSKTPIFKSWITYDVRAPKDPGDPLPSNLYALISYRHPFIDYKYFEAQKMTQQMQGNNNIWFAGLWTNHGDIHESAIISAMTIAEHLAPRSERLVVLEN
jgi:predicted NAD/FAD-binding protein